jgi:hypothetical protein
VLNSLLRSLVTAALIAGGVVALLVAWWVLVAAGLVLAAWQGLGRLLGFPGPLEVLLGRVATRLGGRPAAQAPGTVIEGEYRVDPEEHARIERR